MAPLSDVKLRILAFPQRSSGRSLDVNVLLMPTQRLLYDQAAFPSVLNQGASVQLPAFLNANLGLEIVAIRGLASYPFSNSASLSDGETLEPFPTDAAMPPDLPALYEGLQAQFKVDPTMPAGGAPTPDTDPIRKYLPVSYRSAFNFTNPRTEFAKTDDSYHCAIKRSSEINPAFKQSGDTITWGRVIAFCLRQPDLAARIGLLYRLNVTLSADEYFKDGGWIWCRLTSAAADFSIVDPTKELRSYAARIPAIDIDRQLFAPILFPVVAGPAQPSGDFDTLKIEASDYDDGFAKVVHAVQPVSANILAEEPDGIHVQKDIGVRLGWDDEQILIWQNRQMLSDPSTGQRIEAPLGVFSYRVDVREQSDPNWHSLVRIRNRNALTLAGTEVSPQQTELETGVQVFPSTVNGDNNAQYWLPSYFTQWYGPSLVLPDGRAAQLDATGALANPGTYQDANIKANPGQAGNLYEALIAPEAELKYGHNYLFRVRLADLTGGGPLEDDGELNEAPSTNAPLTFRRYVAPKQLTVTPDDPQPAPGAGAVQVYEGHSFTIGRPRLGYPSLLFTELDTNAAFQHLLDDKADLHPAAPAGGQTIAEYRDVSYFDPDVDQVLVVVDVKTLALDTQASASGREAFIRLYSTIRKFDADLEEPFTLQLDYRGANVINFADSNTFGDLAISKAAIDALDAIVLPTSRDIRITLYPACKEKPALGAYFGFAKTRVDDVLYRLGEPVQFYLREDADDEVNLFAPGLESHELQALYLQPDPPQVNNALTIVSDVIAGSELHQSTLMERLAAQLEVDFKGLTLIGKPGKRIQFGCSNRIRHTLAPDNSSLTFATAQELINHWLCVLSFDVQRDWTWDGLADAGFMFERTREFKGEAGTQETETVGQIEWRKTASRVATSKPDRSFTRVLFVDAVEPKKDAGKPATAAHPYPNVIDLSYTLTPAFIASVAPAAAPREAVLRTVEVPVTTIPTQVPKIVGAGYALSPYQRNHAYSQTAVRERFLWLEFDQPIEDPNDTYFARVLAYAPDQLLAFPNPDQMLVRQDDPPLAIDPELIRVITHAHGRDNAGIDAMQPMTGETADPSAPMAKITPTRYLLPLPPGLHAESPELFGFFTYELRVGHTDAIWCTAQGRFGHPLRLSGVQHPAPPLKVLVERTPAAMSVTAPFATTVFNGRNVTSRPPKTEIWCMLYAQVLQADGKQYRNILLSESRLDVVVREHPGVGGFLAKRAALDLRSFNSLVVNIDAPATGASAWTDKEIRLLLEGFHLDADTPLSVLAVEMMPRYDQYIAFAKQSDADVRPLSRELGQYRILRTSPLVAAPEVCCENC